MFIKKHKDFIILSLILIPVIECIIKGCTYPVWNWLPIYFQNIFTKNQDYEVWYNLSLSYLISYIFFLVVSFLPDIKREKEKEKDLLPLRCARYREIELLIQDIFMIWGEIFKACIANKIIDRNEIKQIDDLFKFNMIKKSLPYIVLSQPAVIYGFAQESWHDKIINGVAVFKTDANTYLTRYKDTAPTSLYFNIFYILNSSFIIGQLPVLIIPATFIYGRAISLDKVINADNLKEQIENTCKYIINLNNWFVEEYKYLTENAPDAKSILKKYDFLSELDKK
jgi:hypothetical protein